MSEMEELKQDIDNRVVASIRSSMNLLNALDLLNKMRMTSKHGDLSSNRLRECRMLASRVRHNGRHIAKDMACLIDQLDEMMGEPRPTMLG